MDEEQQLRVNRYLQQHVSVIGKKIYGMIKQTPLLKADIRKRTNLPTKQIDDELSQLAGYNLIKAIKKPDKKTLNVWVLFHEKQQQEQQEQKIRNQDLIALILKENSTLTLIKKEAVRKSYPLDKLDQILQMLEMRAQIIVKQEQVEIRNLKKIKVPCITCQLKRLCTPGGAISPEACPYLIQW